VRFWDLRKGVTSATLTYHKKSVRALVAHPTEFAFASAGADNIKKFKLPGVRRLRGFNYKGAKIVGSFYTTQLHILAVYLF
jgi:WD40 repeat protein